jgi:hypothetical protein
MRTLSENASHPAHASAARFAVGRPEKEIFGLVAADTGGIPLIQVEFAQHVSTSG